MGNNGNKERHHSLTLQEFVPPTRKKRSPILSKMLMNVVKKIEEKEYLTTPSPYFKPRYVFYGVDDNTFYSEEEKMLLDKAHKLYSELEAREAKERESQMKSKSSIQPNSSDKANASKGVGNQKSAGLKQVEKDTKYAAKAPRGNEGKFNKFFLSQHKSIGSKTTYNAQVTSDWLDSQRDRNNPDSLLGATKSGDLEPAGNKVIGGILKPSINKKLYINCELEKRLFLLPDKVQFVIMCFLIDDYLELTKVSSIWYYKVNELFENHLLGLDNSFIKAYMDILAFKRSYFSIAPYTFSNRNGFRMDRNMIAEILPSLAGKDTLYS